MSVLRCYCIKKMLWKYRGRVQYTMYDTILHLQSNARALHTFTFCKTHRLSVPTVGGDQWDKRHRRGFTEGGLMPVIVTLLRLRIRGVILLQEGAEGRRHPKEDRWLTKKKKVIILRPNGPWWIHDSKKKRKQHLSQGKLTGWSIWVQEQTWWTRGRRFLQVHSIQILCSLLRRKIKTILSCTVVDLSFCMSLDSIKHVKTFWGSVVVKVLRY